MDIPRYWRNVVDNVRKPDGGWIRLKVWGWSNDSDDAAHAVAQSRLSALRGRLGTPEELDRKYAYGSRPLREEILQEFPGADGDLKAVITRNGYGSRVLNAAGMLFIDVDVPHQGLGAMLKRLFTRGDERARIKELARLMTTLEGLNDLEFRVYKTAAGYRAMAVSRLFEPGGREAEEILGAAGADPAFVHLCRLQKSFRARLTPKFWRCGPYLRRPPPYPREDPWSRSSFDEWLQAYEGKSSGWATCRYLETVGSAGIHSDLADLVDIHDTQTHAAEDLPLA